MNRLADETSPYLLQHKDNPVDWYPWGEEAFAASRSLDRPILLSVGYSSCHWCHVMAHESFEDAAIADVMNRLFVNVKVDREERPDVDNVYMTATQALTGSGGWPMTVFLTPDGKPFYAGTYFPPQDAYGKPGFRRVLESIRNAWDTQRDKLLESAAEITAQLTEATRRQGPSAALAPELLSGAAGHFRQVFDSEWGGFGQAPKFPSPSNLEFLLMRGTREVAPPGEPGAQDMALFTLRRMAMGGIYDHLGGGFSRYSVDRFWLVPHFEKMLYDNAQLVRVYLHAFQLTGDDFYARIARETLTYLEREMLDSEGGFYSAQDADSEGIEGKFFVWTPAEIAEVLGSDAELFGELYGVTRDGNFQDPHHPEFGSRNVLSFANERGAAAEHAGLDMAALEAKLESMRARLFAAREARIKPGLDDKVLTSWNGLALAAFAEAGRVLAEPAYVALAERNAAFVRDRMWRDGRLLHTYKAGVARIDGMLEDYAYYGLGLLELYRSTGGLGHLEWAVEIFEQLLGRFRAEDGGFYETAEDAEALILRQKPLYDAATPSGNGAAALLGAWLGRYYGRPDWEAAAEEVVGLAGAQARVHPSGFGTVLQVAELLLSPRREVAIVGPAELRQPFESELASCYLPAMVIAPAESGSGLPVLEGRGEPGMALAYVCEDMTCQLPARTPIDLARQVAEAGR
ncbi:MAG: thioredoxin domain-containing protein [Dehalococcoidia bacterium]